MINLTLPANDEYAEFYADYVRRADSHGDVLAALSRQIDEIKSELGGLSEEQALFRDAPVEWSIKEVVGHICDVERVFSYRMFRIARGDGTPLAGFDQNDYVQAAGFDQVPLRDLLAEFEFMRGANTIAIQHLSAEAIDRRGTASGCDVSVRALIYMLVGHVDHHLASLREKYLPVASTL